MKGTFLRYLEKNDWNYDLEKHCVVITGVATIYDNGKLKFEDVLWDSTIEENIALLKAIVDYSERLGQK